MFLSANNLPQTPSTFTITTCHILHPTTELTTVMPRYVPHPILHRYLLPPLPFSLLPVLPPPSGGFVWEEWGNETGAEPRAFLLGSGWRKEWAP